MTNGVAIPLHLAVHVLGLTVAVALAVTSRRARGAEGWVGFAFGGALLAAAHVISGALIAPDLAWPVYLRAAGYAAIAVGAAGRLVGGGAAPAVVVAPLSAHVTAAVAGAAAAIASVRGIVGRGNDATLLGMGLGVWALADLVARSSPTGAAVLSLIGSAAVGGWVLRGLRASMLSRLVASFVAVLLTAVVALASAGSVVFVSDLQNDELASLQDRATARVVQFTEEWPQELLSTAGALSGGVLADEIRAASAGTLADLDVRARSIAGQLPGVDAVIIIEDGGRVVGSWETGSNAGPLALGDESLVSGDPVVTTVLRGALQAAGIAAFGERDLLTIGAVVVAPTVDGERRLDQRSGALVLGRRITDPRVVGSIEALAGVDASLIIGDAVSVSTLGRDSAAALASAVATSDTARSVDINGTERFLAVAPILGADGAQLGRLALSVPAGALADVEEGFVRTAFATAALGLLVAALLAAVVSARTTRPVQQLTAAAERVAGGDLDVRVRIDRGDEVGRLATAFDGMTASLAERQAALQRAATIEADLRGRLEAVTSSISEAIIAVDAEGRVTTVNRAAVEMLGRSPSKLVGRHVRRVLRGTTAGGGSLIDELGGPEDLEPRAARGAIGRRRRPLPVAATAASLSGSGDEQLGRVYVLRDVTGESEVERMKTEFLANISHELRTPLTPIKGYAEVIRSKDIGREQTVEFARAITDSAERLERIVGMLVDFASLEAGRVEVRLRPTDVSSTVDEVLAAMRTRFPSRDLTRRIKRGLPRVQVDPSLLARVLEEVLDNAVKFSAGRISVLAEKDGSGHVRLTVRDVGTGMEADELEVIMRDFHQADGSATRHHGGLGLGLSIVQRIVDRFNADLVIESEVDEGTDVHLYLPVAPK